MHHLLVSIILLWINNQGLAFGTDNLYNSIQNDLTHLNVSCKHQPFDSCTNPDCCECESNCTEFGTCCLDSKYMSETPIKITSTCIPISWLKGYFMVDRCPMNHGGDQDLDNLCQEKWNEEDNPEMIVPVTSLSTQITYKNIYCFRCNEATEEYYYWPVNLKIISVKDIQIKDSNTYSVKYNRVHKTWEAHLNDGDIPIPVIFNVLEPDQRNPLTDCNPNIISHCLKSWLDKDTRDKCEAYMDIFPIYKKWKVYKYKNVHCALCNSEDTTNNVSPFCSGGGSGGGGYCGGDGGGGGAGGGVLGFNILLDFNARKKANENCNDGFWWDEPFEKCRRLRKIVQAFPK